MRKVMIALMALMMGTATVSAQTTREIVKERKVLAKASKSELEKKASKTARKEAKKLKREGWQVAPGALPLEKQLDKSYMMQYEYDEDLFPKYLMGEAMSIGENYDAADTATIYQRATAICKMHKARVRANNYYWNKLFRKLELEGEREAYEKNKRESNVTNC